MGVSASIVFMLGVVHFIYTFWGAKLTPRDPALQTSMSQVSPVIPKETTMWRCWVGFRAVRVEASQLINWPAASNRKDRGRFDIAEELGH